MATLTVDELLDAIAEHSHELCSMVQQIQAIEGQGSSNQWLRIFDEITRAWFANDEERLQEIADFIYFGTRTDIYPSDIKQMILGPGPLTNH